MIARPGRPGKSGGLWGNLPRCPGRHIPPGGIRGRRPAGGDIHPPRPQVGAGRPSAGGRLQSTPPITVPAGGRPAAIPAKAGLGQPRGLWGQPASRWRAFSPRMRRPENGERSTTPGSALGAPAKGDCGPLGLPRNQRGRPWGSRPDGYLSHPAGVSGCPRASWERPAVWQPPTVGRDGPPRPASL